MITKMQPLTNIAVPQQAVTTQPQQIVGVPANAVILKMSEIQQISTVGTCNIRHFILKLMYRLSHNIKNAVVAVPQISYLWPVMCWF